MGNLNLAASSNQDIIESPHNHYQVKVEEPKAQRPSGEPPFEGYIDFQGIEIDIENKKGSTRSGTDPGGRDWSVKMHAHYGEIRGTEGTDGDKLDVYVGDNHDSSVVVVVHQQDPYSGKFDEDKVLLGFDSPEEAIGCFKKQYNKPGFFRDGEFLTMPIGQFWRWVHEERNRGRKVRATKTLHEREDEATERLIHKSPKKKPPRMDLRRRRVDVDTQEDPDEKADKKDLSNRYRDAADRVLHRFLQKMAGPEWAEGKKFNNRETGNQVGFDSLPPDQRAELLEKHKKVRDEDSQGSQGTSGDTPNSERSLHERDKTEARKKRVNEALDSVAGLSEVGGKLEARLRGMGVRDQLAFSEALQRASQQLSQRGPGDLRAFHDQVVRMKSALSEGTEKDPKKLAEAAAAVQYYDKVVDEPLVDPDEPIPPSGAPLRGSDLKAAQRRALSRAEKAVEKYKILSKADRDRHSEKIQKEIDNLAEGDPRRIHLEAVHQGLKFASVLTEGDQASGIGSSVARLIQAAEKSGDLDDLLSVPGFGAGGSLQSADQIVIEKVYSGLRGEDWSQVLPDNHPGKPLTDLLSDPHKSRFLTESDRARVREHLTQMLVAEVAFLDPAATQNLSPGASVKAHGNAASKIRAQAIPERTPSPDSPVSEWYRWLRRYIKNLAKLRKRGSRPPIPPSAVACLYVPPVGIQALSSRVAEGVINDTIQEISMSDQPKLTRLGALNVTRPLDRLAALFERPENAVILGVDPRVAHDFAYRCDQMQDVIEATAIANYPQEEGVNWDPSQIGEEVSGPLEQIDDDEPYMDTFTESEHHELGDLVKEDSLSDIQSFLDQAEKVISASGPSDEITSNIQALEYLSDKVQELLSQIKSSVSSVPQRDLPAEVSKIYSAVIKDFSPSLKSISQTLEQRKKDLVKVQEQIKIYKNKDMPIEMGMAKDDLMDSTEDLIQTTETEMKTLERQLRVIFHGLELEQRAHGRLATQRIAGLEDLLSQFRDMILKNYRHISQVGVRSARLVEKAGKSFDEALRTFGAVQKQVSRRASQGSPPASHDFNLFK